MDRNNDNGLVNNLSSSSFACNKKSVAMKTKKIWSKKEIEYLRNNYGKKTSKEIAKDLNRTESAIRNQVVRIGLTLKELSEDMIYVKDFSKIAKVSRRRLAELRKNNGLPIVKERKNGGKNCRTVMSLDKFWKWYKNNQELLNLIRMEQGALGPEPKWFIKKRLMSKKSLLEMRNEGKLTIKGMARKIGITEKELRILFKKYNISPNPSRKWTKEECEYVRENIGVSTVKVIAKTLGRTEGAVKIQASKLNMGRIVDISGKLNMNDFCSITGLSRDYVIGLIKDYDFPAKKKVVVSTGKYWRIDIDEFWEWVYNNKERINLHRMEEGALGLEPKWMKEKRQEDIMKAKKPFTPYEDNMLKFLANKGENIKSIAKELGRSYKSVYMRARRLGIR